MNETIFTDIKMYLNRHAKIKNLPTFQTWYEKERFFMKWEEKVLRGLADFLSQKYGDFYQLSTLKKMKKLFLLYPDALLDAFTHLSWNHILVLIDIFDEDKREFYISLCCQEKLSVSRLKYYIHQDLYEKCLYCYATYYSEDPIGSLKEYQYFLRQVMSVVERII